MRGGVVARILRRLRRIARRRLWRRPNGEAVSSRRIQSTYASLEPGRRDFGFSGGTPVDRYYIAKFLEDKSPHIQGVVAEFGSASYTKRYSSNLRRAEIIAPTPAAFPNATIFADLRQPFTLPSQAFDAVICTQTLHVLPDPALAIRTLRESLRPSGTLLVTIPLLAHISSVDADLWGDFWRMTPQGVRELMYREFDESEVTFEQYGNKLAATHQLNCLPAELLARRLLDFVDHEYIMITGVVAQKLCR